MNKTSNRYHDFSPMRGEAGDQHIRDHIRKTKANGAEQTNVAPTVRVVTYRRVSSARQVRSEGDFGSLQKQTSAIQQFLSSGSPKNWIVVHEIEDAAELGDDPTRPGIKKAADMARRSEFDVLVVASQDRLARGADTLKPIVNQLEACGIEIYDTQKRRISYADPSLASQTIITAAISEIEQRTIRDRRGFDTAVTAANGYWTGGRPPTGYTAPKIDRTRMLKLDPKWAKLILEIFKRIAECESVGSILQDLRQRKLLTPSFISKKGKELGRRRFTWEHILTIIRNPTYKGFVRLTARTYNRFKKQIPAPLEFLPNGDALYKGKHEALISADLWAKANAALEGREKIQRKPWKADLEGRFLLQGIFFCGDCGTRMTPVKKGLGHYACMSVERPSRSTTCKCGVRRIPASIAEDAVIRMLCEVAKHPDFTAAMLELSKPTPGVARKLQGLRAERGKLTQQCDNLISAIATAGSHETRADLTARLDQTKLQIHSVRRELEAAAGFGEGSFATAAALQSTIDALQSAIGNRDRPKLKSLLRILFKSVIIERVGRGTEIRFRIKLVLNYPALAGHAGHATQLHMEIAVPPDSRSYRINAPFAEERDVQQSASSVPECFPLAMMERFATLAETKSGAQIASECGKTRAHVSQVLSLRRIEPRLRSRILSAEPAKRHKFSLRKLLAIAKLAPSLQAQEVEFLLKPDRPKAA